MHVVCKWIGNGQPVAAKHYLQLTDEHFERALLSGEATQNPAHAAPLRDRTAAYKKGEDPAFPEENEVLRTYTNVQAPRRGDELVSITAKSANDLRQSAVSSGAESGALGAHSAQIGDDLRAVVEAWPGLPPDAQRAIQAIVRGVAEDDRK